MSSQRINCTVHSCRYNEQNCTCGLHEINICACKNCSSGLPDESKCGSYECRSC